METKNTILVRKMNLHIQDFDNMVNASKDIQLKYIDKVPFHLLLKDDASNKELFIEITKNKSKDSDSLQKYINENWYIYYYSFMSKELKADREYIKKLLKIDGSILEYLDKNMQYNYYLDILALENDHSKYQNSYNVMHPNMKKNDQVISKYIEKLYDRCSLDEMKHIFYNEEIQHFLSKQNNVINLIKIDPLFIKIIPINYLNIDDCIIALNLLFESSIINSTEDYQKIESIMNNLQYNDIETKKEK